MSDKKNQISGDEQKASSITQEQSSAPAAETKKKIRKAPKVKKPRKKGLPIAVDILIVILLLGVIAGAVWGVYALGNYIAAQREITYTLLAKNVNAELALDADGECVVLPGTDVVVVGEEKNTSVGKVLSVTAEPKEDGTVDVYVVVRTMANYNHKLGYFANGTKIAVGKVYTCRFCGLVSNAVITELQIAEGET